VVLCKRVVALSKANNNLLEAFDRGLLSVMLRHGIRPKGRSGQIGRASY